MKIISLQIDDELLNRFNSIKDKRGYTSKSKALRDCIVESIEKYEKFEIEKGIKIMTLNLIYNVEIGILSQVVDLSEKYKSLIKSTMDWRIAEKKIEVILVIGDVNHIRDFYNDIVRIKDMTSSIHEIIID